MTTKSIPQPFAHIFNDEDIGQILIKLDVNEDGDKDEIRYYFKPSGLGICSAAMIYKEDTPFNEVLKEFNNITEESAIKTVQALAVQMGTYLHSVDETDETKPTPTEIPHD